jgi:transmembrane sensor
MNTNYKEFTTEDFITDETFIAWCKNGHNSEFWKELSTDPNINAVMVEAKSTLLKLHDITVDTNSIDITSKDKLWARIDNSTSGKTISINKRILTYLAGSIAACFLLIFAYNSISNNVVTPAIPKTIIASKSLENIQLPDQSNVSILKGSEVSFDNSTFTKERTIHLKGHAFFKVEKGSEFNVITNQGSVRVLGTSFDVIESENNLKVICYTGKVEVVSQGKKVILTPGEETDFNTSTLKKSSILHGEAPAYISGRLSFNQVAISDVVEILEKEFDINIIADQEFLAKKYSGDILLDNLDKAMKSITWPYHLSYSKKGGEITINKNEN